MNFFEPEILNRVLETFTDEELRNVRKGAVKYYSARIRSSRVNSHLTEESDVYMEKMQALSKVINDELWARVV